MTPRPAVAAFIPGSNNKGSLVSEVLDQALFTLPVGQLSEILEDRHGFHIIRVVQRSDPDLMPFADAQVEIKKKIRDERTSDKRQKYLAGLRKKIRVWNIFKDAEVREAEPADESSSLPDDDAALLAVNDEAENAAVPNRTESCFRSLMPRRSSRFRGFAFWPG